MFAAAAITDQSKDNGTNNNRTSPKNLGHVFETDGRIRDVLKQYGDTYSLGCVNVLRLIYCTALFCPWANTVWCGPFTKADLKSTVAQLCQTSSNNIAGRFIGSDISMIIDMNLPNYYQRGSNGEPVGNNNAACQEVNVGLGKHYNYAAFYIQCYDLSHMILFFMLLISSQA